MDNVTDPATTRSHVASSARLSPGGVELYWVEDAIGVIGSWCWSVLTDAARGWSVCRPSGWTVPHAGETAEPGVPSQASVEDRRDPGGYVAMAARTLPPSSIHRTRDQNDPTERITPPVPAKQVSLRRNEGSRACQWWREGTSSQRPSSRNRSVVTMKETGPDRKCLLRPAINRS